MLEKFKNILICFIFQLCLSSFLAGTAFNLAMDPTICTCLLFGFSQSESHCAVDGLVDHACLFLYIGFTWFIFYLSNLLICQAGWDFFSLLAFLSVLLSLQPFINGIYLWSIMLVPGTSSFLGDLLPFPMHWPLVFIKFSVGGNKRRKRWNKMLKA